MTERLVELATGWGISAGTGPPLIVVGPSGSGKSSLLAAGLMSRLPASATLIVPTSTPAADLGGQLPAEVRYLIVDQFESVFTRCQDEDQRREFITAVCDLAAKATVILALRADFYDQALRYPELADALQSRQVVLGPMTADQVRQAIVEPARRAGLEVEDGLAELLLRDLAPKTPGAQGAHEPGALPLLSHALLSTWELSSTGTITVADYQASGGISDAITRTAEGVFTGLSAEEREMARRLFLRLVHVADDTPPTRSVVRLAELDSWSASAIGLLGRFVDERLITVDADSAQIAHDALPTAWPRLRSWIDAGLDDLRTRRRITEAARIWEETGRDGSALPRGAQLAIARDWAADEGNRAALSPLASEFVAAAVTEEQAASAPSGTAPAGQAAGRRADRAGRGGGRAGRILLPAADEGRLGAQRRRLPRGGRGGRAGPRAERPAGGPAEPGRVRDRPDPEARASVLESSGTPSAARLTDSPDVVESVSLNRGRGLLAAAAADGSLRLWNVTKPGHPRRPAAAGPLADRFAVHHGDQPVRDPAGRGRGGPPGLAVEHRRPGPAGTGGPAPDRPGRHGVLGGVQPRRPPAGGGQRRRQGPAVERDQPAGPGAAGHAARAGRVRGVGRVQPVGPAAAAGSADKTVRLWSGPIRPGRHRWASR